MTWGSAHSIIHVKKQGEELDMVPVMVPVLLLVYLYRKLL